MSILNSFRSGIVILAAGSSSRMGQAKQLLPWGEGTLLQHVVRTAIKSKLGPVAVVLGANADLIEPTLMNEKVQIVQNDNFNLGQSSSIASGVAWAKQESLDGILFVLGDQPALTSSSFQKVIQAVHAQVRAIQKPLVAASYRETVGVPAFFGSFYYSELLALTGEQGAKSILLKYENELEVIHLPEGELDLDTPAEYEAAISTQKSFPPSPQAFLQDSYGRQFEYLRLSLTDACNFKCKYCLPHGYHSDEKEGPLSRQEIVNLVSAFAELGTWKIRLTGGEPTLRADLLDIVRDIREIPGVKKIALSTNGSKLKKLAAPLRLAGLQSLNISIDSLDPAIFSEMTGMDRLSEVQNGIDESLKLSFDSVKINSVLMKDTFREELDRFEKWVFATPVTVRFIELMPTHSTREYFEKNHISASHIREELIARGWEKLKREPGAGPAEEWSHSAARGRLGVIAPYGKEFCSTCNRLRVSSRGELRLCLFAESNQSLRPLLQNASQRKILKTRLCELVLGKDKTHYLPEGRYGNNFSFSSIGG